MKIYTLGTGHGSATMTRFHQSTAYETVDGAVYIVDAGDPVAALYLRAGLPFSAIRGVFISHMHIDHTAGLFALMHEIKKRRLNGAPLVTLSLPEKEAIDAYKTWDKVQHAPEFDYLRFNLITEGVIYEDNYLEVTAHLTQHLFREDNTPCSYAFSLYFKRENKRILHSGDLAWGFVDFPGAAQEQHYDACVLEATHYSPQHAAPILKNAKFSRLIFSHISDRWHGADSASGVVGEGEAALAAYAEQYPYPTVIAHDGDVFEI